MRIWHRVLRVDSKPPEVARLPRQRGISWGGPRQPWECRPPRLLTPHARPVSATAALQLALSDRPPVLSPRCPGSRALERKGGPEEAPARGLPASTRPSGPALPRVFSNGLSTFLTVGGVRGSAIFRGANPGSKMPCSYQPWGPSQEVGVQEGDWAVRGCLPLQRRACIPQPKVEAGSAASGQTGQHLGGPGV